MAGVGACLEAGKWLPEAEHEAGEGPRRSRINRFSLVNKMHSKIWNEWGKRPCSPTVIRKSLFSQAAAHMPVHLSISLYLHFVSLICYIQKMFLAWRNTNQKTIGKAEASKNNTEVARKTTSMPLVGQIRVMTSVQTRNCVRAWKLLLTLQLAWKLTVWLTD